MKKGRHSIAVVLDEYGGMSGIITINDLVEQLVGDLYDDNETEEENLIEPMGEGFWKIHGSALLEDISDITGVSLTCDDYDTFNGLIFHTLGTIPEDGSGIEIEVANLIVQVTQIQNHQVETALVHLKNDNDTIER